MSTIQTVGRNAIVGLIQFLAVAKTKCQQRQYEECLNFQGLEITPNVPPLHEVANFVTAYFQLKIKILAK
jgi:hypothetical protein